MSGEPVEPARFRDAEAERRGIVAALARIRRLYLMRAAGTLLLAGGVTAAIAYWRLEWNGGVVSSVLIAAAIAFGMGWVSFLASCRSLLVTRPGATPVMVSLLGGMLLCALLLLLGALLTAFAFGPGWGERVVVMAAIFYLLLLMLKIVTLQQSLRRAPPAAGGTTNEGRGA